MNNVTPISPRKPRTAAQIEASRRNGALSRGPKTLHGKRNSSQNAITHGLVAKVALMDGECQETFKHLIKSLETIFNPADLYEISLVETMAMAKWRFLRTVSMERAGFRRYSPAPTLQSTDPNSSDPATRAFAAFDLLSKNNTLTLMNRVEARHDRQYNYAVAQLFQYRRDQPQHPPSPAQLQALSNV